MRFLDLFAIVIGVVLGSFFITGTIVWLFWNYGVAAVVDVKHLAYWPACFIGLAIGVLRQKALS